MQEQLIQYETAVLAKKKGFDEPCRDFYPDLSWNSKELYHGLHVGEGEYEVDRGAFGDVIKVPTQSLLQSWLRVVHNVYLTALPYRGEDFEDNLQWYYSLVFDEGLEILCNENDLGTNESGFYNTFEEALEHGLKQALLLIEKKE